MTRHRTRPRAAAALLAVSTLAAALPAFSQTYPTKPVRIVNPFSPGGSLDLVARALAKHMSAELGQSVLVDNRPGAGGSIGIELVAKAPPDGHTLLIIQSSITINPSLQAKVPYDPIKDFAPISKTTEYMFFLVAHPSVPVKSVKALIALDQRKPGLITYASVGVGSGTHLSGELFNYMAGTKLTHIPYKGTGQAMPDLLGGHVAIMFGSTSVVPHAKSGKLVPLAVTGLARSRTLPEAPTIAESGLPGYEVTSWNALFAPAGTPEAIIKRLNVLTRDALAQPEAKSAMEKQEMDITPSTPDELGKMVRSELAKWGKVVKAAGIKPN